MSAFAVRTIELPGEEFPVIVDSETEMPNFQATKFVLQMRQRNLAFNTLLQAARAVMVLLNFLLLRSIDLRDRFEHGWVLTIEEIEALHGVCKQYLRLQVTTDAKVTKLHKKGVAQKSVGGGLEAIRLFYIKEYLKWEMSSALLKMPSRHPSRAALSENKQIVLDALLARIAPASQRNSVGKRKGLSKALAQKLRDLVRPENPENPWTQDFVKVRNQLVVEWLLAIGLRRGEFLVELVSDIDFQSGDLLVPRRPDNASDPRSVKPNTKTKDRLLALEKPLVKLTRTYVLEWRSKTKKASSHGYLLVSNSGAPLSVSGFNAIFSQLRERYPDLYKALYPHLLRHTWNERFSELMDELKKPSSEEEKLRSHQMGWKEGSGTASIYTRRHTQRKANEASLEHQRRMLQMKGDDD